jgi:hypothetical protein
MARVLTEGFVPHEIGNASFSTLAMGEFAKPPAVSRRRNSASYEVAD